MSEHNLNFYSLKEVERCLEASKEFQDGEEIYYFIGTLRYLYDENKELKSQLQQKENIIKEAKEILNNKRSILTTQFLNGEYFDYEELLYQVDEEIRKILDNEKV